VNPRREALILITDGTQNAPRGPVPTQDVPTYVIALGVSSVSEPGLKLRALAKDSGGEHYPVKTPDELQSAVAGIDGHLTCAAPVAVSAGTAAPPATQEVDPTPESVPVAAGQAVTFTSAPLKAPAAKPRLKSVTVVVSWNKRKARVLVRQ